MTIISKTPPPTGMQAHDGDHREKTLKTACKEFESLMLKQMLSSMRNTTEGSLDDTHAGQLIQDMFDDNLAQGVARKGGIGIAEILFDRLKDRL